MVNRDVYKTGIKHTISIDFEEWYQTKSLAHIFPEKTWNSLEGRLPLQTELLLNLFEEHNITATFFIVGWTAKKYPDLIKRIFTAGHEIASHSYLHIPIPEMSQKQFKEDLSRSKSCLEELTGERVHGFRAPSWSLTKETMWAVDTLQELGFEYDSSVFPISLRYGQKKSPRQPFQFPNGLWEFPFSTIRIGNYNVPVGGGAFFRAQPFWLTSMSLRYYSIKKQQFILYFHPWEFDPEHPKIKLNPKSWFVHYYNLEHTLPRLKHLIKKNNYSTFIDTLQQLKNQKQK